MLVTRLGVSVEKVVATMDTPTSHHGAARPDVKNSAVLFPALRKKKIAGRKEMTTDAATIPQSSAVNRIRTPPNSEPRSGVRIYRGGVGAGSPGPGCSGPGPGFRNRDQRDVELLLRRRNPRAASSSPRAAIPHSERVGIGLDGVMTPGLGDTVTVGVFVGVLVGVLVGVFV